MSKRARILIVDDERSIRELLEIVLKKDGFNVTSVRSAVEALTILKSSDFDLIISDIKMPDMTGIDLLRQLRETTFGGQFILLTAFASAETAIQALKMGAFDYILKTENFIEELKLVVYSALEHRRHREEQEDAGALQDDRGRQRHEQHGSDHRGERDGKGTGRKGHPPE